MASPQADTGNRPETGARPNRPRELQDPLNRFIYHPLAHKLALALRPTGVSPNAVSICGALLIMAAAVAYVGLPWPQSALIGFVLHALWHVVDGADGDLARLTGKASPFGELVDGLCDYAGHGVLYVALAIFLDDIWGIWAWLLSLVAAMSHSIQTNHSESQRRTYLWWVYGVPWLKHTQSSSAEIFRRRHIFARLSAWLAQTYIRVAAWMNPDAGAIDAAAAAARKDPAEEARFRSLAREALGTSLVLQKLLGANPRTLILGISMALGSPVYFFAAECIALNLLLIFSLAHHSRAKSRLARRLSGEN